MRTIHKQSLTISDSQTIEVPKGADLLTVQVQHKTTCVWYLCDPEQPTETVTIYCRGTGHQMSVEGVRYLGTTQHPFEYLDHPSAVFHWFEDEQRA